MRFLVVGGTGWVGRHLVRNLQEEHEVYFSYCKNESLAKELIRWPERAHFFSLNFLAPIGVEAQLKFLGDIALDGVVLSVAAPKNLTSPEQWQVSVEGPRLLCESLMNFNFQGGGNIVFINTLVGTKLVPAPVDVAMNSGAIHGLVGSMAKSWGHRGVKVNQLALGLLEKGVSADLDSKSRANYLQHCTLKRFGEPSEVAYWVEWLLTQNSYLTAQSIVLDGGL